MRSIVTGNLEVCCLCGSMDNVELHHCIHGSKEKRSLATQYHLLVGLCSSCHRGPEGVHSKLGQYKDLQLKSAAQEAWIARKLKKSDVKTYEHGLKKWMEIFETDFTAEYNKLEENR